MKSFVGQHLEKMSITHTMLGSIRAIAEFKGRQALYSKQMPQVLETLRQAAIVMSTESSNRLEQVTAPLKRIEALVARKTTPKNRSEQEIAGYRDVLDTIHTRGPHVPFKTGVVLQFHRDLFRQTGLPAGKWKNQDNEILEIRADGSAAIRFKPLSAAATPDAMDTLHKEFATRWNHGAIDNLVLIPAYILDFLCIHPFLDGNGRVSRLLSLLLLYQAGYEVGRYISLERIIEDSKETYYEALHLSSRAWHSGKHDLTPWTEYFLGTMLAAYKEFEGRVGVLSSARGTKTEMVEHAVRSLPDGFRMADLERVCPTVSREMIRVVLKRLKKTGAVRREGAGVGAVWRKGGNNS